MSPIRDLLVQAPTGCPPLTGSLQVPPDKSISHRVLLLAALAEGTSQLEQVLAGEDVRDTLRALQQLGVEAEIVGESPDNGAMDLSIEGVGQRGFTSPRQPLYMGNSGTGMRLLAGLLCGRGVRVTLTGDDSLMRRPMRRIVEPLRLMGADIRCGDDGCPPLEIYPSAKPLTPIEYRLPVASAQVKSAVLLAGLTADGDTQVEEPLDSLSRDHTEHLLCALGRARLTDSEKSGQRWRQVSVSGDKAPLKPLRLRLPADPSSAAFPALAASLRPGSRLTLPGVGINPTRIGFFTKLEQMGVSIRQLNRRQAAGEPVADLEIRAGTLTGCQVSPREVPALVDEIPALATAGYFARRGLEVRGAQELRHKETDRLAALLELFRQLGAAERIEEFDDGFALGPAPENPVMAGGKIDSGGDHRIAMAFAAACPLAGELRIGNSNCIATSYPGFVAGMKRIGVELAEVPTDD